MPRTSTRSTTDFRTDQRRQYDAANALKYVSKLTSDSPARSTDVLVGAWARRVLLSDST
ncbi:Uncharacterised protein [Mycobacteroides abscessus subsp. abscessus]|nr:Uncharacterised protein [Mycobacteroides abscessus subsp. abscessus]